MRLHTRHNTLRTRHNTLNSHRHDKLKLAPSPACLCGQTDQTTEHVLQRCPLCKVTREDVWPVSTPLTTKLYGAQAGAGEDDFIYLLSGPDHVVCKRQEEEEAKEDTAPRCACSSDAAGPAVPVIAFNADNEEVTKHMNRLRWLTILFSRMCTCRTLDAGKDCAVEAISRHQRRLLWLLSECDCQCFGQWCRFHNLDTVQPKCTKA